jgi:aquaporin related protein
MLAGMAAAGFVSGLLPGPLIIGTTLHPSISVPRGLFLECFVTSQLVLTILMLKGGDAKPMYIGFSLFIAEMCSVYFTGGSLNPARSFGPAVVVGFDSYHWIYWVGPLTGAVILRQQTPNHHHRMSGSPRRGMIHGYSHDFVISIRFLTL